MNAPVPERLRGLLDEAHEVNAPVSQCLRGLLCQACDVNAPVSQRLRGLLDKVELLVDVEERLVEALAEDEALDALRELRHLAELQ